MGLIKKMLLFLKHCLINIVKISLSLSSFLLADVGLLIDFQVPGRISTINKSLIDLKIDFKVNSKETRFLLKRYYFNDNLSGIQEKMKIHRIYLSYWLEKVKKRGKRCNCIIFWEKLKYFFLWDLHLQRYRETGYVCVWVGGWILGELWFL